MGAGHGWRRWFQATGLPGWMRFGTAPAPAPAPDAERRVLQSQADALQVELDEIRKRLDELAGQGVEKT